MTRIERLQPVIQLNDKKEQRALQEVAKRQIAVEAEQTRLNQLNDYKDEYLQSKNSDSGLFNALELQEFSRFLDQLDNTIGHQEEIVRLRELELERQRRCWITTRIDSKKIHKVVENFQQQEQVELGRKEQKLLDEFSQRKRSQS
jgi:flagellar FliJ protein